MPSPRTGRTAAKTTGKQDAKKRAHSLEVDRKEQSKKTKTIDGRLKEIDTTIATHKKEITKLEAEKTQLLAEKATAQKKVGEINDEIMAIANDFKQQVEVSVNFSPGASGAESGEEDAPQPSTSAAATRGKGAATKKKASYLHGAKTASKAEPTEKSESEISDVPKKTAPSPKSSPKKQPAKAVPKPASPPKSPVKNATGAKKDEEPSDFPVGTKVFAQWLEAFYPAEIKGTDPYDRLKVFYLEDEKQKTVSKAAVVPLSKLIAGGQIMYSPLDPEAIGHEVEIVKPPTADKDPKVSVRNKVTKDQNTVPWVQLYFTRQQKEDLVSEDTSASAPAATARRTVIKKSSK